jgi:hypothetical protein
MGINLVRNCSNWPNLTYLIVVMSCGVHFTANFVLIESISRVIAREGGRSSSPSAAAAYWIPVFAGMTRENSNHRTSSNSPESAIAT